MKKIIVMLMIICYTNPMFAQSIKLPCTLDSKMVIQHNSNVKLWGWSLPNKKVKVKVSWSKEKYETYADGRGKWRIKIKTPEASFIPLEICISNPKDKIVLTDILAGDVWFVSGQSNMEMDFRGNPDQPTANAQKIMLRANQQGIRLFRVKDGYALEASDTVKVEGKWSYMSPESVKTFSTIGYIFGEKIYNMEKIPIGLVQSAHGGSTVEAWLDKKALIEFGEFDLDFSKKPIDQIWYAMEPNLLYNKMLQPLLPMKIKGVIWYQGESNVERPEQYSRLFPFMINKWREYFEDPKLPFYYVQITPYAYENVNSAELREVQMKMQDQIENVGMVVTLDVGEEYISHPARKEIVGERLAYWALNKVYGHTAFGCRGPEYDTMEVKNGKAILKFRFAPNGLSFFGKKPVGFEIAGKDRIFHPAKVGIVPAFWGNEGLEVWNEDVTEPVAVRYGYTNYVDGCLYNTEGLPASSFRTDNW